VPVAGHHDLKIRYITADKICWVNTASRALIAVDAQGKVLHTIENADLHGDWFINEFGILIVSLDKQLTGHLRRFNFKGEEQPIDERKLCPEGVPYLVYALNDQGDYVIHDRVVNLQRGELRRWSLPDHTSGFVLWRALYKDNKGRIWLGDDFGLYQLTISRSRFNRYLYSKSKHQEERKSIRGMLTHGDQLLVNVDQIGLFEADLKTGQSQMRPGSAHFGNYGLWLLSNHEIWSGRQKSIYRFVPGTSGGRLQTTDFTTWSICEDAQGNRWLGTEAHGLQVIAQGKETPEPFTRFNGFDELGTAFVLYIATDKAGYLWACANTGLYKIDPQKGVVARWWTGGKGEYHLPADNFYHFYTDDDGIFWIATTNGLLRVPSRESHKGSRHPAWIEAGSKRFNRSDGLPSETVYAVYEDRHGRLWLPTDQGIVCLDKKTGWVDIYYEADGIAHNEFNRAAHCKASDGTLYFGGLNGVTAFHPDEFKSEGDQVSDMPLVITRLEQLNGADNRLEDRTGELLRSATITLRPDDRYFSVEMALLSYESVHLVQYAWKIEGLDKDWHYQKERHINYGGLPYGRFTLRLKARSADGRWSDEVQVAVHSLRPWYLQTWFLVLMAALLAYGFRWYIRRRSRHHIEAQQKLERLVATATERIEQDKQTIQRQAEELRHLDKVKSNFFANVSHELRTPLTLILGPLGSVLQRNKLENQDFTLVKLAQMHARQLLQLVNQILDLSKMENDKLELRETPVRLYPFLRRVAAAFESHADQRGILFTFRFKVEKDLSVLLDAPKVETILNNLLSNALKFTPSDADGKVDLTVEHSGHSIQISVADTGRGIHPDDLPHVFNRFYQSQQPGAPIEGGTGIGLALCKELAELMQGSIRAESRELGAGSTFFLEIPLREVLGLQPEEPEWTGEDDLSVAALVPLDTAGATADQPLVLVVEDNASLRNYVQAVLSGQYRVVCAANGQEALEYLESASTKVSLIISDIMMPVMDGFQLLQRLKNAEAYWQVPVIMLTARADVRDQLLALRIGVDDYLLKPFESEELLARVSALLARYREKTQLMPEITEQGIVQDPGDLEETDLTAGELAFLEELETVVRRELRNETLSVGWLAAHFYMSERQLQRRINRLTGLSPNAYLREVRLETARFMLEQRSVQTMKEAALEVGFRDEKHFSQLFRERFGKSPAEYLR
jgi:signal transduction histidine kinase/DNA-binding response OmpR family regulator/ligand-binding sensor domain-containing protein